jgi:glucose/mannose transport system substrate-binding protein
MTPILTAWHRSFNAYLASNYPAKAYVKVTFMMMRPSFNYGPACRHAFLAMAAGLALCASAPSRADELEVAHYWDVAGEAKAIAFLRSTFTRQGYEWRDFAVAGGGNGLALSLLKSRVASGNPPAAAQVKASAIGQWAQTGQLADLDDIAKAQGWDTLLPGVVSSRMKYQGHYVAVPVNIHRNNWLWINSSVLKRVHARIPTTWDEFFEAAELMKRAGIVAVAHSGQPWENQWLFESVVIGTGGTDFYRKAMVQLDPAALGGAEMERALQVFRRIKSYTDHSSQQRDWLQASGMLVSGQAGMEIMGDWNKPVLMAAQKTSDFEFECVPVPGTAKAFVFDTDSFVMFKEKAATKLKAQWVFATTILRPDVQEGFNLEKGSIPVRLGIDLGRYDRCARASKSAFQQAAQANTLLPSISMAQGPAVEQAIRSVISDYWRDDRITPHMAITRLVALARRR